MEDPHKNILTDSYDLSLSYELMDTLSTPEAEDQSVNSIPAPDYSGYWYNGKSIEPYYLSIQEDSSGSFLNIEVYSDYYKWTATARPSTTDTFTYDDGFQQSYSEDFNLPDLEGTITFDFDKHTVTWTDDSDETVTFTTSISASDFNSFVEKVTAVTESYSDDSQPTIEPIDLAGHYWCEQNSGDAYSDDDKSKTADLNPVRGLLDKRQELSDQIEQLEQEKTAIEQQVKLKMQDAAYGTAPGYKVSWVSSESKRVDSQRLRKEQPDIFNQYSKNVSSRRFTIIHAA